MKITPKWSFVKGSFDTSEVKMLCVPSHEDVVVELCVKEKGGAWNYPVASIKLHSRNSYADFNETYDDAVKLCEEIARRWNECQNKL